MSSHIRRQEAYDFYNGFFELHPDASLTEAVKAADVEDVVLSRDLAGKARQAVLSRNAAAAAALAKASSPEQRDTKGTDATMAAVPSSPVTPQQDVVSQAVREFATKLKSSGLAFESFVLQIGPAWETEFTYERRISASGKVML